MHDYVLALLGGTLIGVAAILVMLANGHIMGVSGIVSRLLPPTASDWDWRLMFVLGTVLTPVLFVAISGQTPEFTITDNPVWLVLAGLLVGFGTVIGNGCTSGHGVCGLARLSIRSLVATGVFMVAAAITVYIMRHIAA